MGISQEDLEEVASREIKYIWSALLPLVKLIHDHIKPLKNEWMLPLVCRED